MGFSFQTGSNGTNFDMKIPGNSGRANIMPGEDKDGGLFGGLKKLPGTFGKAVSNVGSSVKGLFVGDSENPSVTAEVLTLGNAGSDVPPPPKDVAPAPATASVATESQELDKFLAGSDSSSAAPQNDGRLAPVEQQQTQREISAQAEADAFALLQERNIPIGDILYAKQQNPDLSYSTMLYNDSTNKAIDGGEKGNPQMTLQAQRELEAIKAGFDNPVYVQQEQYATNGISATALGAQRTVASAQMMVG